MHNANWDDLRFVLAVAEHGSVSAAARVLNVNHATVLRRVAAFEDRYGSTVFNKTQRGYTVDPARLAVIEAAREVDAAVMAVARAIEGARAPLRGVVRVTSTDTFCCSILPDAVSALKENSPDLRIDLICSNAHLDFSRLAADVTVRPTLSLPEELSGGTF